MASDLAADVLAELRKRCEQAGKSSLVSEMASLYGFLTREGLCYQQVLDFDALGTHNANRDGQGVSCNHVHRLLSDIAALGYAKGSGATICLELPPMPEELRKFNQKLVQDSAEGRYPLAPCSHRMRYATVAGSHFAQACKLVLRGVSHEDPDLTVNGKLSLEMVQRKDPKLADAIKGGVPWRVVSWQVQAACPEFAHLAQAAANASQGITQVESELQLASRMLRLMIQKKASKYDDISAELLRSRPQGAMSLPYIFAFLVKFQGNEEGELFRATEEYVRSHGFPQRSHGHMFWEELSRDCRGSDQKLFWRHMLLKTSYCASEKALTHGEVKRSLCSKDMQGSLNTALHFYTKVRSSIMHGQTMASASVARLIGELEIALCSWVLDKKQSAECLEARAGLEKNVKDVVKEDLAWPWALEDDAAGAPAPAEPAQPQLQRKNQPLGNN